MGAPDARPPHPGRSDIAEGTPRGLPAEMFVHLFMSGRSGGCGPPAEPNREVTVPLGSTIIVLLIPTIAPVILNLSHSILTHEPPACQCPQKVSITVKNLINHESRFPSLPSCSTPGSPASNSQSNSSQNSSHTSPCIETASNARSRSRSPTSDRES
jgi:hypothetical protein